MSHPQHYDLIASEYRASKQLPFRLHVEANTLFRVLGDVAGKDVLVLACGEGIYARQLKRLGARSVLGIDLSPVMVRMAREAEDREPLGCVYLVADVAAIGRVGEFDAVTGVYLLNYARSYEGLLAFCRVIRENLRPGGRFVGVNDNTAVGPEHFERYRPYGFVKRGRSPQREGDAIGYTFFNADGSTFEFDNYYLAPSTYERAFAAAGLREFAWCGPWLDDAGVRNHPAGFWDDFMAHPPVIGLEATA